MPAETRELRVYEANRVGLPPLVPYFREMWRRREFAFELSRSTLRSQQSVTFFGQLWLVINPLLLATVYYFLVFILSGGKAHGSDYFSHLLGGLFAFYFVSTSMVTGASSVTSVGKLIANQSFPRLLLPFSSVLVSFRRFLPTMIVYIAAHLLTHQPITAAQLLAIPAFMLMFVFAFGVAALTATLQVYFRDISSFLPYFQRIWLYLSPVLYYPDQVRESLQVVMPFNPLYGLLGCWTDALVRGEVPPARLWIFAVSWTFIALIGGCFVFLRREREFAVRI